MARPVPQPSPETGSPRPDAATRYCCRVDEAEKDMRLDAFLAGRLRESGFSREKIKRLIREGKVAVDGVGEPSPKFPLPGGSVVTVATEPPPPALEPEEGVLDILYRDAALAVINKPAGLTVHPAPGKPDGTLAHRLLAHFPELAEQEGFRPGIVHRLDKDTSGLMLVALSAQSRLALAELFARHKVFKEYLALVRGVPARQEEDIDAPIARHPTRKTHMAVVAKGKAASSRRRTLFADPRGRFSLQAVRIFSGRTHQIRVHMQHIGHPLLGDDIYGDPLDRAAAGLSRRRTDTEDALPLHTPGRQMLHAWRLAFVHPLPERIRPSCPHGGATAPDSRMAFVCPPPADFSAAVRTVLREPLRVVITGSPGCGKSALLALLREANLPVFSADAEVARLYAPGADGHSLLRRYFGSRFVPDAKGPVDKAALGAAFRADATVRRDVEALLHPLVFHALRLFWREQEALEQPLAVAEIPLYLEAEGSRYESGKTPPLLVGVHCPFALRKQRLCEKRGWTKEFVADMESWQWPEDKKMQACDLVVNNTGSLDDLRVTAGDLLETLRAAALTRENDAMAAVERLWTEGSENFPPCN